MSDILIIKHGSLGDLIQATLTAAATAGSEDAAAATTQDPDHIARLDQIRRLLSVIGAA